MAEHNIPLATTSWDDAEYAAIDRVVKSGFFSMGKEVEAFEKEFAEAMGVPFTIMVNSGSSANLLMVSALRYHSKHDLPAGAEVIVPAVSWSTTYYPLYQYGLVQRFVDIDPQTLNYDLDVLEAAITDSTRAIMVVNLLGNPNDFNRIQALADRHDLIVIEDNCESLGATFEGQQAGTFGIAGTYSSYFSHHISTMEGGLIATRDEELYHLMLSLRSHGWTRHLPHKNLVTGQKSDDPFEESFRFVLPGYNLRPLEMSGAIGREQIKKLPMIVSERRKNAEQFHNLMRDYQSIRTQQEVGQSSWFGFSMVVEPDAGFSRSDLLASFEAHGIDCRPIVAGNFAKNPVVSDHMPHNIHGTLKHANDVDANGLFIGNHHYPLEDGWSHLKAALDTVHLK